MVRSGDGGGIPEMSPEMPPGQQGKGQGLSLGIANAYLGQWTYRHATAATTQLLHQPGVTTPPAGHQHF